MKQQAPTAPVPSLPHLLSLSERSALGVSGVRDVESFDDTMVLLYTDLGKLTVQGSGLHITRLNIESGDLNLEGYIDALTYTDTHAQKGGFFGKLFR